MGVVSLMKKTGQKILLGLLAMAMTVTVSGCDGLQSQQGKDITVSIYGGDIIQVDGDTPVKQALENQLDVKLEYIDSTWEIRHTKLNAMISSGKIPDLFTYGYTEGTNVENFIQQNVIAELTPYIEQYPNIQKRMEEFKAVTGYGQEPSYFIPIKSTDTDSSVVCEHAWFYRKDIIDEIGLEVPQNAEELYQFLKLIKQYYTDRGIDNVYPLTLQDAYFMYCIYDLFDTGVAGVEQVGGELAPTAVGENMKQAILFIKKLYEEKLLDTEFMLTPNWQFMANKFLSGQAVVMYTNYKFDILSGLCRSMYPEGNPMDYIAYIPVMKNISGEKKVRGSYNYFGGLYFKKEDNPAKMQKKLELVDYMLSDDGMKLLRYGVEGEHYQMENGKPISLLGKKADGEPLRIADIDSSASIKALVTYDVLFMDDATIDKEYITEIRDECLKYAKVADEFMYRIPQNQMSIDKVALEEFAETSLLNLIIGNGDFESEWKKYCKRYMERGGTELVKYASNSYTN